ERAAEEIVSLLALSEGRALVLTSSYRALAVYRDHVRGRVPYDVLVQGEAPRERLLERFREEVGSVLLATSTFWQGVDVPGEALSLLVIDKLPFSAPGDPLHEARCEAVEQAGGDWFRGFGRARMDGRFSRRCRAARWSRISRRSAHSSAGTSPFPLEWRDRMAKKKPRTPTPPRRVQAPQRRAAATPDPAARHRMILYGISGAGFVGLIVVVLIVALAGGSSNAKAAIKTIRAQGCQYRKYPALPRTPHYATLTPNPPPKWNSFPPTSGRHFYQPLPFGIYTEPVP